MNKSDIKSILSQNMDLRDKLFARGFLFTNDNVIENEYPFYGLWKKEKISHFLFKKQDFSRLYRIYFLRRFS